MKIAKYVGDLLYDYECVVIPGLGGFLTHDKPAAINAASNLFKPPFKQVQFNAYLKTNDGLLVNYVAREEGIEYKAAKEQVDRFVLLCDQALKEGKRINFHKIGYLYLNEHYKISFEQDTSVNYNADAFGLTGFISPAVYKPTPEEKLREKAVTAASPVSEKKPPNLSENRKGDDAASVRKNRIERKPMIASRRRSPYRTQMTVLMIMILAIFVGWGFMHKTVIKKYYRNYSSVIPLFYSSPNAYLIENINHEPLSKISKSKTGLWIVSLFEKMEHNRSKETVPKTTNDEAQAVAKTSGKTKPNISSSKTSQVKAVENKMPKQISGAVSTTTAKKENAPDDHGTLEVKKKTQDSVSSTTLGSWDQLAPGGKHVYIIAGAFRYKSNAENLIHKLRLMGYPAMEAGVTRSGLVRVAFAEFKNTEEAEEQLLAIRKNENPSAWIFEN